MGQHIIFVGAVYIDTILSVPKFPIEDQKLRATGLTRRRGGNCPNTLEVLSQLLLKDYEKASDPTSPQAIDPKLFLLAVLPNQTSDAVKLVRNSLENVNVDDLCVFRSQCSEAATSIILQNTKENTRTIINHNPLPEMTTAEFIAKVSRFAQSQETYAEGWYHFEGRIPDITVQCVEYLLSAQDQRGFRISVECEKPDRAELLDVAKKAHVVFYSKLWAEGHGYGDAEEFLRAQLDVTREDAMLCCTWGAGGATVAQKSSNGCQWAQVKAWQAASGPSQVVDTVGAGDTFVAGMMYALSRREKGWDLQQKLAFANELAGRKVIQDGFAGLADKLSTFTVPHV